MICNANRIEWSQESSYSLAILQGLEPLLSGHFCIFLKSSHFSNISSFSKPFFA